MQGPQTDARASREGSPVHRRLRPRGSARTGRMPSRPGPAGWRGHHASDASGAVVRARRCDPPGLARR